jgi:uncharacterized LabA/DUF88 family protein
MASKSSGDLSSRPGERVMVFIDGSNLYHVLGEICGRHDLQFDKFGVKLANGRDLRRIYYYNIRQESERYPEQAREQEKFLASLHDMAYMEVRLGIIKQRGEEMVEKGVDVMLATDLVVKALRDQYDTAIVVSGDGDFFPAYQAVKDVGKHVEVAAFDANLSAEAARTADVYIKLNKTWFTGLWMSRRGGTPETGDDRTERADRPQGDRDSSLRPEGDRDSSLRPEGDRDSSLRERRKPEPRRQRVRSAETSVRRGGRRRVPSRISPERAGPATPSLASVEPAPEVASPAGEAPSAGSGARSGALRPGIRRTPARRRIGGTVGSGAGGQAKGDADQPSERPVPPALRNVPAESGANGAEPAGNGSEASTVPESAAAESGAGEGSRSRTARRAGWLRRLRIGNPEGNAGPATEA